MSNICQCKYSYESYCISPEGCKDLQDGDLVIPESILLEEEVVRKYE